MAKKPKGLTRAKKTLKRSDICREIHHKTGFSVAQSSDLVEQIFGTISEALIGGEDVKLAGFGTFKLSQKAQRLGRNPKTKKEVVIKPRKVVTFKPSTMMKDRVNSALGNESKSSTGNLTLTRATPRSRLMPVKTSAFKTSQWIAVFRLLGLLTFENEKINIKKLDAFINTGFELKIINDPKMPITKPSAKSWLKTNEKRLLVIRQTRDETSMIKMLNHLSPAAFKLDIICAMVKISIADGQYGQFEQDLIKKAILHWNIPAKFNLDIDYSCSDMILKTLWSVKDSSEK